MDGERLLLSVRFGNMTQTVEDTVAPWKIKEIIDYRLDEDQRHILEADVIRAIVKDEAPRAGPIFFRDKVITRMFVLVLADDQGNQKGFHCPKCANSMKEWFILNQAKWKVVYHDEPATALGKAPIEKPQRLH